MGELMSITIEHVPDPYVSGGPSQSAATRLAERLRGRQAQVVVMGLGYAGLPMAVEFARAGFPVTGLDIDEDRVQRVNLGISPVSDVADAEVSKLVGDSRLRASNEFALLDSADCVVICVPTPLTAEREPDLSCVWNAAHSIAEHLHPGLLIVLQSTCSPGTTRGVLLPILKSATRLQVGHDFFVAFAPERIDPGNRRFNIHNTPKIVGGITPTCTQHAALLFGPIVERIVKVSSPEIGETAKLLENAFRFINISFVNEMAMLCDRIGVNIWETIDAASTKPFAFMSHYPGPGVGGHCIPIVPFFLEATAREHGMQGLMIDAAGKVNDGMPEFVVDKLERLLSKRGKSLAQTHALVLGVAYKADTNDVRESPALHVIKLLQRRGARVDYYDPHVPTVQCNGTHLQSLTASDTVQQRFDCAVLLTDHSGVDHAALAERVDVFLDTRGRLHPVAGGSGATLAGGRE
jgi:UDP-N-acetyl-D-glucosamine dehydrogenase